MSVVKLDLHPAPRTLRQFGLIGLFAFSMLAVLAHYRIALFAYVPDGSALLTLYVLGILAVYCGLGAAADPRFLWPLYALLSVAMFPVGFVTFHVAMALVYYVVFTPVAVVFKVVGRDAMKRRFDPSADTYWIPRKPPENVKRYFRQF